MSSNSQGPVLTTLIWRKKAVAYKVYKNSTIIGLNVTKYKRRAVAFILKVYCPARWILHNLGSFHSSSLKEASRRLFRKIRPSPIEWEPFDARAPSRTVIAHYALNSQMRSKAHTTVTAPLVLYHTRIYKCAMKKFGFNGQCVMNLFYCQLSFFTGKRRYERCTRL